MHGVMVERTGLCLLSSAITRIHFYRNIMPQRGEFIWEEVVYIGTFIPIPRAVTSLISCSLLNIRNWGVCVFNPEFGHTRCLLFKRDSEISSPFANSKEKMNCNIPHIYNFHTLFVQTTIKLNR